MPLLFKLWKEIMEYSLKRLFNLQNIPFFIVILLIGLFFFIGNIYITQDGVWYLNTASNILQGKGYTETDGENSLIRAPIFQFILIGFYKLFGESLFAAVLVLRIFWAMVILLFFLFVRSFFNWQIALGATLLILTTPELYLLSYYLLIDYPSVLFILLLLILSLKILERENDFFLYFLMGLVMGIGTLFKENMMLFFPLPFVLLFLKTQKNRIRVKKGLIYLISFLLIISPWLLYINLINKGNLRPFLGGGLSEILRYSRLNSGLFSMQPLGTTSFDVINRLFVITFLAPNRFFIFGIFGLLAWVYFFYKSFRSRSKNLRYLILISVFILYLPLMVIIASTKDWGGGLNLWGLKRQLIGLSFATIIVLTVSVYDTLKYFFKKSAKSLSKILSPEKQYLVFDIIFLAAILSISILSVSRVPFSHNFNLITNAKIGLTSRDNIQVTGLLNEENKKLAQEISLVIPEGSNVMVWRTSGEILRFFLRDRYSFIFFPAYYLADNLPSYQIAPTDYMNREKKVLNDKNKKVLFVWTEFPDRASIQYLSEEDLFEALGRNSVQYVITSHTLNSFSIYFEKNPCFEKIFATDDDFAKIFKVKSLDPMETFTPLLDEELKQLILNAHKGGEDKLLDAILQDFKRNFGWSREYVYNLAEKQEVEIHYYKPR